ncbi:MAG TPA: RNA polymerase sigma factor [Solirubrobacteraceae bacterium]|nr:RNA polymerase sigma factor [Solirubrobacteraceae bacterium]
MSAASVTAAGSVLSPPAAALRLMSDERVARWAAKGSEAAFAVIFERHHQALHRYCHSILGNGHDAADALQSTMLRALRALPGETRVIALKPWLYRIAHNESISLLRARRADSDLDAASEIGGQAADAIVESRERLRDLTGDLQQLTEQQRGALLMRELAGLAFAEVAGALQIKETAARQSVYEARRALQDLEAGRAMDCDLVRRTLSDGGRRTLRGLKMRGHLRACAGCRDFEAAMAQRPAQLAALAPPLPLAAAASILHGLLGGGGGHSGGGLLAGLSMGGAKGIAGASLTAKIATVAVVGSTIAGGAAVTVPALDASPNRAATSPAATAAPADRSRVPISHTSTLQREAARARAAKASRARAAADRAAANRASAATRPGARPTTTRATASPAQAAGAGAAARRGNRRAPSTKPPASATRKPTQRPTPTTSVTRPTAAPTPPPMPATPTSPGGAAPPPVTPIAPVTTPAAPPPPDVLGRADGALSPR